MLPIKRTSSQRSTYPTHRPSPAWLAPALALLLAGCGNAPQGDPDALAAPDAASSDPAATGSPDTSRFDQFAPRIGTLDTRLFYCAPRRASEARENCDLDGILSEIADDVVEPVREEIEASPDPEEYAEVSATVDGMEEAIEELGSCEDWFTSEERDSSSECGQAWTSLASNWSDFTRAVDYGVS